MSWQGFLSGRSPRTARLEPDRPHPAAQYVIEQLSQNRLSTDADIAAIRRHYNLSRRAFLSDLEPVESVFHVVPSDGIAPRLTVIRPKSFQPGTLQPALVYLHGGGWSLGSLATYEPLCRQLANATGQIVIWVEYRLAPEHRYPAALDDTLAAWQWVQDHCRELGADPERLSLGGDSAGGNLAAAAVLTLRDENGVQPWRQLLFYPCVDMSASLASHRKFADGYLLTAPLYAWYRSNYAGSAVDRDNWRMSPLFAEDFSGLPPAYIMLGGYDPLHDEGLAYGEKLRAAGVKVAIADYTEMVHCFIYLQTVLPQAHDAMAVAARAVKKALEDA